MYFKQPAQAASNLEHLDAALIRLGQIDITTRDVNAQLLASIFRSNILDKEEAKSEKAKEETILKQPAADFASTMQVYESSPADI
jgi:hypothetical protein